MDHLPNSAFSKWSLTMLLVVHLQQPLVPLIPATRSLQLFGLYVYAKPTTGGSEVMRIWA
jgi:hypothetical protein